MRRRRVRYRLPQGMTHKRCAILILGHRALAEQTQLLAVRHFRGVPERSLGRYGQRGASKTNQKASCRGFRRSPVPSPLPSLRSTSAAAPTSDHRRIVAERASDGNMNIFMIKRAAALQQDER